MKDTKEGLIERHTMFMDLRTQHSKDVNSPPTYRFNNISINACRNVYTYRWASCKMFGKGTRVANQFVKRIIRFEESLPHFKTNYNRQCVTDEGMDP